MSAAPPAIKSQPQYRGLTWDASGQAHLLLLAARDDALLASLLGALPSAPIRVIDCADALAAFSAPAALEVTRAASLETALGLLDDALARASMGLRLYLAGPEDAIWQAHTIAAAYGMGRREIRLCQTGSLARPVFCVHCRSMTRHVRTNIVPCAGCGRALFVRDHFSRRLGAYMGFQIDAEAPGQVPPAETVYP
ncbi:MAG: hypothetical protein FGM40_01600 [Rhodocyclaceae bacterium]|nr:hypothetical protein [Rhodocyclaceae bacterium]